MNKVITDEFRYSLRKAYYSIELLHEKSALYTSVSQNFLGLYRTSRLYIQERLQCSDLSLHPALLERELLHTQDYTYLQSLSTSPFSSNETLSVVYMTPINLNIRPFRAKAGIESLSDVYSYTLRSLLRFALTAYASIYTARQLYPLLGIKHVLAIDTEPVMSEFISLLFNNDPGILVMPVDLSSYDYASDSQGRRPPNLIYSVSRFLSRLASSTNSAIVASVNLDSDDLISPLHPALVSKYVSLCPAELREASYLCFPLGLQLNAMSNDLYSYSGCSNCFMATLSKPASDEVFHVWATAHDRLNAMIPYRNIPTWNPVWAECIWNSNINNSIWPSSNLLSNDHQSIILRQLFGIQRSMIQLLASI